MIKLVIWDLDDTFWAGTLAEGTVEIIDSNIEIVKILNKRGIVNSIVSKNNFKDVRTFMESLGIWDLFIFPSVSYEPKGKIVKDTIKKFQLRPNNTLFIDDNFSNRKEVEFYNNKIIVRSEKFISDMLNFSKLKGSEDPFLIRFNQYKALEIKYIDQKNFSDNKYFLEQSNIKITIRSAVLSDLVRVVDLINRTNQLNYTKNRVSEEEARGLIEIDSVTSKVIHAKDKYGDYGIVGFYAIENNQVSHFLFSCRILNLGIEQFIYSYLNFPDIKIVGEIVTKLNPIDAPSWIFLVDDDEEEFTSNSKNQKIVLFKGGCDMTGMLHYLSSSNDVNIIEETNYVAKNNISIHNDHTISLLNFKVLNANQKANLIKEIPFIDNKFFETEVFSSNYDILVFSVLMDYSQEVYREKNSNIKIIFGGSNKSLADSSQWQYLLELYKKRSISEINLEFLNFFKRKYDHLGKISENDFASNLSLIRDAIPNHIPIIFLNGAEIEVEAINQDSSSELDRFKSMNNELDLFILNNKNCYLVDVRKIIIDRAEILDNIRHYSPQAYFKISKELSRIIKKIYPVNMYVPLLAQIKLNLRNVKFFSLVYNFLGKLKNKYILKL
jgi:FkbH-like protein